MSKKLFKKICRMSQKELKKYLADTLKETYDDVTIDDGFVYAQGNFPVLLVAHLDTVHAHLPYEIDGRNGKLSSPNGIGGDDRCGVYMILQIMKQYNCSILFCEDEEIGTVGAEKFTKTELAKSLIDQFNYIIEFDRKGNNDAVFYECDNKDFESFITQDFYKSAWGSFSDISVVAPFLKVAAVNLSCGYYNAHTNKEYVVWDEMIRSAEEAMKILDRTTEKDKFEYIEYQYTGKYYSGKYQDYNDPFYDGYGFYKNLDDNNAIMESWYVIEFEASNGLIDSYDIEALSIEEAIGYFCIDNPKIPYNKITDIYCI